ncbi:MAG: SoxR reducing system RseC family protein [Paludibacteraceae bacterium]|nr:SoxR reducing system RseC family protein [Paludibacteraceae bacterium]
MSQSESNSHFSQEESCHSCALKTVCKQTEEDCFTRGQRWKAITLAYLVPLVLVIGLIAIGSFFKRSEFEMAIKAILGVALYYFILWLTKPKI